MATGGMAGLGECRVQPAELCALDFAAAAFRLIPAQIELLDCTPVEGRVEAEEGVKD